MSEANKEQADKCFLIARESLRSKNKEKAIRFLEKSIKLYPMSEAKSLLAALLSAKDNNDAEKEGLRHRHSHSENKQQQAPKPAPPQYSQEQIGEIKAVLRLTDYYKILNLERTCSASDIKKAYRKVGYVFLLLLCVSCFLLPLHFPSSLFFLSLFIFFFFLLFLHLLLFIVSSNDCPY